MEKEKIGYAWNFVADLGNSRQFSINGNFEKGSTAEEINAEVDKIAAVVNRQQAKNAILGVQQEIEQAEFRLDSASKDLAALDDKHKDGRFTVAEKQQREMAVTHLSKMGDDIKYRKGVLAKLQEEAK